MTEMTIRRGDRRRECGDCQLCCRLLPMKPEPPHTEAMEAMIERGFATPDEFVGMKPEWFKPAGKRCQYQRHHKGCTIYRQRPFGCRVWNCRWLVNDTDDLPRPDHAHYVIDIMPDIITMAPNDGSPPTDFNVIVIWCDPKHPEAHRDPALRRYLARQAEQNHMAAIVRFNNREALALFAPFFDSLKRGEWWEYYSAAPTPGFKALHERLRDANSDYRVRLKVAP
jgi:Putative zinc- or iron-chelating domain